MQKLNENTNYQYYNVIDLYFISELTNFLSKYLSPKKIREVFKNEDCATKIKNII